MRRITPYQASALSKGQTTFTLGRYSITDSITEGASCSLFIGEHHLLGTHAAIKVATAPASQQRLIDEARLFRDVTNPLIAKCLGVEQDLNVTFMAREFVPGIPLQLARRFTTLPTTVVLATFVQCAELCHYMALHNIGMNGYGWCDQLILSTDGAIHFVSSSRCTGDSHYSASEVRYTAIFRKSVNAIARECLGFSSKQHEMTILRDLVHSNGVNEMNDTTVPVNATIEAYLDRLV
jgi:hypothetical protein